MDERRRIRVYIAGPMTNGGKGYDMKSIHEAINVHLQLIKLGFVPHCPQLTVFCDFMAPGQVSYDEWLKLDMCYIDDCDVLLRLPGKSKGADRECQYALDKDIPLIRGLGNFLVAYQTYYDGKVPA